MSRQYCADILPISHAAPAAHGTKVIKELNILAELVDRVEESNSVALDYLKGKVTSESKLP